MSKKEINFISDIKNAITVIIGISSLISVRTGDAQIKEYSKVISNQSTNILKILDNFFNLN